MTALLGFVGAPIFGLLTWLHIRNSISDWSSAESPLKAMYVASSVWMLAMTFLFAFIAGGGFGR